MSNSLRNTLVLCGLLILIIAFGIFQSRRITKQSQEIKLLNQISKAEIDSLNILIQTKETLQKQYQLYEALSTQQSKLILGQDNPTITYRYLLGILNWMKRVVNFDFAANAADKPENNYHEYIISGKAYYPNLLHLTSQIEQQRAVITIEDLSIATDTSAKSDTVSFSMVLHTHFMSGGADPASLTLRPTETPYTGYQLFNARLSNELMPYEVDPELVNTDHVKLIGISRGMAFFRDEQGIIRILSQGSPVAYGYLNSIVESEGKVTFRLDKYGLEEDYSMYINKPR